MVQGDKLALGLAPIVFFVITVGTIQGGLPFNVLSQ